MYVYVSVKQKIPAAISSEASAQPIKFLVPRVCDRNIYIYVYTHIYLYCRYAADVYLNVDKF